MSEDCEGCWERDNIILQLRAQVHAVAVAAGAAKPDGPTPPLTAEEIERFARDPHDSVYADTDHVCHPRNPTCPPKKGAKKKAP